MQNVIYTIRVTNNDFQPNRVAKILFRIVQLNVMFTNCGMPCCAKNIRCHHLYMWEEIMAKLISWPFMLSWIESTVNWLKTRNLLRNADPSIPYKIGYKPEIYRTAPQYPHVLNRGYFHIEEFPLYFVRSLSCVLRQNFLPYKLFGSQLLMFFYRTWVPFKSIKKRKRSAVDYKILPCFDSLTVLLSVFNIDHEGRKKLFWFIRF